MSLTKVMTAVATLVLVLLLSLITLQVLEWQHYRAEPSLWPPVQPLQ